MTVTVREHTDIAKIIIKQLLSLLSYSSIVPCMQLTKFGIP